MQRLSTIFSEIRDKLKAHSTVYADKEYYSRPAVISRKQKKRHLAAIKKNNMKNKNHTLDRWYSIIGVSVERVFPRRNPQVRYRGEKNQFAAPLCRLLAVT